MHEQSIKKFGNLHIPIPNVKDLIKFIHQNTIKYLTHLILKKA